MRPTVGHIAGTVDFERTVSTIVWLQAHGHDEDYFWPTNNYGEPVEDPHIPGAPYVERREKQAYNRTVWLLKIRLNKFIREKIAVFCNGGTLQHQEIGWL